MAEKLIGLDLGTSTIKAVEVTIKKDVPTITNAYMLPMKGDSIIDGTIIEYSEVSAQVRNVVEAGGFVSKKIAIPLKGSSSITRFVHMPMINEDILKRDMLYIIDQYLQVDPEEFAIDYSIIRTNLTDAMADVVLGATRREVLSDYVSVMESAELAVGAVDSESLALCNLYNTLKYPEGETSMILHVGHMGTLVILLMNGHFVYHEFSPTGGRYCNDLLINLAHVPEDSVEIVKLTPDLSSYGEVSKKVIMQNFMPELSRDIEKIINNYQILGGTDPVRAYLSGGGATLSGLEGYLADELKINVSVMNPRPIIAVESSIALQALEKAPAILNVALAMALR